MERGVAVTVEDVEASSCIKTRDVVYILTLDLCRA